MTEVMVCEDSLPEAYHEALSALYSLGELTPCPDYNTQQLECSMTICVKHPLQEPMISKLFFGSPESLEQYTQEMLDGILDFEIDKGNWEYTYHDRMTNFHREERKNINQVQFVIDELKRNPYSRRAVISIRSADDMSIDCADPACMQHIQFFMRDNALHCKVLFRSNDAIEASFNNMYALIRLQERIANELGYEVGTYTHRANSFHCYAKDFSALEGCMNRIIDNNEELCYYYDSEDGWKPMMEEAKEEIKRKVDELYARMVEEVREEIKRKREELNART